MDPKVKAKGRANSALRIGLREAREELKAKGHRRAAERCTRALKRSERLEANG